MIGRWQDRAIKRQKELDNEKIDNLELGM